MSSHLNHGNELCEQQEIWAGHKSGGHSHKLLSKFISPFGSISNPLLCKSLSAFQVILNGYLSNSCGERFKKLFVTRLRSNRIEITIANNIKPVLYSTAVKNGSRNIQNTTLYAFRIKESGCINSCLIRASLFDFSFSHANRMDV